VDAFNAVEFDVARRGRAANERDRAPRITPGKHFWHRLDDLIGAHDAHVYVGHERDGAPALVRRGVEHDRPSLGARDNAGGHDRREPFQFNCPQLCPIGLSFRQQVPRQATGDEDGAAARSSLGKGHGDSLREALIIGPANGCLVVDQTVLEQSEDC
jgi:hypothetical protein